MSETTPVVPVTGQPKVVEATHQEKVLSRLSEGLPGGETVKTITPTTKPKIETSTQITEKLEGVITEPTAEEKTALIAEAKELGLPETATKEEVEKFKADKTAETTWKIDDKVVSPEEQNDGTFKGLAEALELGDLPADYSEEKGFETVQSLLNAKYETIKADAIKEASLDRFVDVPEAHRGEAEMLVELMKTGLTLEKINEPFMQLAAYKALSKEEQVRDRLMNRFKGDEEVVDLKMQKLVEDGQLDLEHRAIQLEIAEYEEQLKQGRQHEIEKFKNNQRQIQAQKVNQENTKLTIALDKVQEFLGKSLPSEVKAQLKNELLTDQYRNMPGSAEEKVDYFLDRKFGKTARAYFKDKVLGDLALKNKQEGHNVPILTTGVVNRIEETKTGKSEVQRRLEAEFGVTK